MGINTDYGISYYSKLHTKNNFCTRQKGVKCIKKGNPTHLWLGIGHSIRVVWPRVAAEIRARVAQVGLGRVELRFEPAVRRRADHSCWIDGAGVGRGGVMARVGGLLPGVGGGRQSLWPQVGRAGRFEPQVGWGWGQIGSRGVCCCVVIRPGVGRTGGILLCVGRGSG